MNTVEPRPIRCVAALALLLAAASVEGKEPRTIRLAPSSAAAGARDAGTIRLAAAAPTRTLWERWVAGVLPPVAAVGAAEPTEDAESVRKVAAGEADAACILAPLPSSALAARPSLVDLPVAVGALAVVYNLTVAGDLRVTPEILDGILRGSITRWRDPALLAANPGVVIPDLPVSVFLQSPAAGDTQTLRDYLRHALGAGATWSSWVGKTMNDPRELADAVRTGDGAVAYLDAALARRASLYLASIRNRDGVFVQPSMRSVSHAAVGVRLPDDFRASIVDARGPEAYPIATFAHAVFDAHLEPERRRPLFALLRWALRDGQRETPALGYAPLPGLVARALEARLEQLDSSKTAAAH